jgi:hypothetical protein
LRSTRPRGVDRGRHNHDATEPVAESTPTHFAFFGSPTCLRSWSEIERERADRASSRYHAIRNTGESPQEALVAAERRRELRKTVRERLAEIAEAKAERIAAVYLEGMEAVDERGNPDHRSRVRAADAFLAQAFGRPPLSIEVEKQDEETIIIVSPVMSALKEGLEAQERELEAAPAALPPGAD